MDDEKRRANLWNPNTSATKTTCGVWPPGLSRTWSMSRRHYQNSSDIECIDAISAATGDGFQFHLQGTVRNTYGVTATRANLSRSSLVSGQAH